MDNLASLKVAGVRESGRGREAPRAPAPLLKVHGLVWEVPMSFPEIYYRYQ
jgi:hypothetical protein